MVRPLRFVYLNLPLILKLALISIVVIDTGYLIYEYRIKNYLLSYLAAKFAVPSVQGKADECEDDYWWFHTYKSDGKPWEYILPEEREFPIAYTILAFERPDQVWRLLKSIYRPQNYYCIHFDKKSPELYRKWLQKRIATCIPQEEAKNVFFIPSISVYHSYMSVLEADLACMKALWQLPSKDPASKSPPWKYLINLTGQEFPLKNNLELTRILRVLNNANLIQQEVFFSSRKALRAPPHGITLYKGAVHIVATWDYINFLFTNKLVKDLLEYLPEVGVPDEALFSTVNHDPIFNAPGNFPYGDAIYKRGGYFYNRFKQFYPKACKGVWRHSVCIFNLHGMKPLFDPASPFFFVNKFVMHLNADVMDVTEEWFYNWQAWYYRHAGENITELNFYRQLPQVKYQLHRIPSISAAEAVSKL